MTRFYATCMVCEATWWNTNETRLRAGCAPCGHQGLFTVKGENIRYLEILMKIRAVYSKYGIPEPPSLENVIRLVKREEK